MNALTLALEALGIVAMVLVHRHQLRGLSSFFEDRLKAQDEAEEERRVALYKQQKATSKTVQQSDRAVRKMADEARNLHENARLMQDRADTMLKEAREIGR